MKRLTKQKRDQLILVSIVILVVLIGLWFLVIRAQKEGLAALREEKVSKETKETQMHDKINTSKTVETELTNVASKLMDKEESMVSGDPYASLVNTIRKFKLHYKLDIPQFSPAASVSEVDLLPKFPYKQIKISISGTGYYEEIGKFVSDFENEYASSRVLNLEMSPGSSSEGKEKLAFKMDIVALVATGLVDSSQFSMKTLRSSYIVLFLSAAVTLSVVAANPTPATKPAAAPEPEVVPKSEFSTPKKLGEAHDPFFPERLMAGEEIKTQTTNARPSSVTCLVLKGLSGTAADPLAMINGRTMGRGEDAEIVTDCGRLLVHCVDITTNSAIVEVAGERREIRLRSEF